MVSEIREYLTFRLGADVVAICPPVPQSNFIDGSEDRPAFVKESDSPTANDLTV
jgi:hypothetical protein